MYNNNIITLFIVVAIILYYQNQLINKISYNMILSQNEIKNFDEDNIDSPGSRCQAMYREYIIFHSFVRKIKDYGSNYHKQKNRVQIVRNIC